jgi:hypothetical protein
MATQKSGDSSGALPGGDDRSQEQQRPVALEPDDLSYNLSNKRACRESQSPTKRK